LDFRLKEGTSPLVITHACPRPTLSRCGSNRPRFGLGGGRAGGSQPGAPPYNARGIYDTECILIETLDGSLLSETRTILDILETEFSVLPRQDDHVSIPFHEGVRGGEFIVSDRSAQGNAGGEITLRLKRICPPKLIGT